MFLFFFRHENSFSTRCCRSGDLLQRKQGSAPPPSFFSPPRSSFSPSRCSFGKLAQQQHNNTGTHGTLVETYFHPQHPPVVQEELAEARRKRRLNVLFLGMTRVAEYDAKGGLAKGMKRFGLVERMVREDVNEANMNPLRSVVVRALSRTAAEGLVIIRQCVVSSGSVCVRRCLWMILPIR